MLRCKFYFRDLLFSLCSPFTGASQVALVVKNLPANAEDVRDVGSIPGLGRFSGGGHGNPLQYSCLENPHGQRSLPGYNPYGQKESNVTKATEHTCKGSLKKLVAIIRMFG